MGRYVFLSFFLEVGIPFCVFKQKPKVGFEKKKSQGEAMLKETVYHTSQFLCQNKVITPCL